MGEEGEGEVCSHRMTCCHSPVRGPSRPKRLPAMDTSEHGGPHATRSHGGSFSRPSTDGAISVPGKRTPNIAWQKGLESQSSTRRCPARCSPRSSPPQPLKSDATRSDSRPPALWSGFRRSCPPGPLAGAGRGAAPRVLIAAEAGACERVAE